MAPRVLVDATDVPADRGALGRYVDGLIGALDVAGADLAVVCQRSDEERYERLAGTARLLVRHASGRGQVRDGPDRQVAARIRELIQDGAGDLTADDLAAAALGRSGRQALLAIAEAYRRFAIEHAGLYSLTQAALDPSSTAQQAEASRAVEVLGAAIRSYCVPDDLSIHAIRMVRAGLHGFADIEARGGFQMLLSVDESFLVLIDALDASLNNLGRTRK